MPAATGLQIAFLVFAVHFLAMLATAGLARLGNWPASALPVLGQWVTVTVGLLLLAAVAPLRRWAIAQWRVPVPARAWPELAAATAIKACVPFAVLGAGAAWMLAVSPGEPPPGYRTHDPALAWEITLLPARLLHLVLVTWLIGPVLEELVFRGLLYEAVERQAGWTRAVAASSLLFALAHPTHLPAAGLGGLVLACVRRRTGSLRACVAVHALYNVLVSWPLLGQWLFTPRAGDLADASTWALPLACLALALVALPACLWVARNPLGAASGPPTPA